MIKGHGDDIYQYPEIHLNFSSNVFYGYDHSGLQQHLAKRMSCIDNYPEPDNHSFEAFLAQHLGIASNEVIVTNGATEAIYLTAQAWRGVDSCILQPTFAEYAEACRINKHAIVQQGGNMLWLCNPNNPTGEVLPKELLMGQIASHPDVVFVIDQSYERFTREPLIANAEAVALPNVMLIHSMTKDYAIPGLRIGYITGNSTLLNNIRQVRMPWAVNALAIEAGRYLIEHHKDYDFNLDNLLLETRRLAQELKGIEVIEVHPSDSHILLCRTTRGNATELKEYLAHTHGILIRDASNISGLNESYFRIATQGTSANNALINALKEWNCQTKDY